MRTYENEVKESYYHKVFGIGSERQQGSPEILRSECILKKGNNKDGDNPNIFSGAEKGLPNFLLQ